jgi:hypothetical protein
MKKITGLTLLVCAGSTQQKKEGVVVFGDNTTGFTVSYKAKTLWSESAIDTTRMKIQILKK